jgi:hypothetical protein
MAYRRDFRSRIGDAFQHTFTFLTDAGGVGDISDESFNLIAYDDEGGTALFDIEDWDPEWTRSDAAGTMAVLIPDDSAHWVSALSTPSKKPRLELIATNGTTGARRTFVAGPFERVQRGRADEAGVSGTEITLNPDGEVTAVTVVDVTGVRAAQTAAETAQTAAETAQTAAETAQAGAEAARDAAVVAVSGIGIYASTAAGIAGTVDGEYFYVLNTGAGTLTLYENVTESATARGSSVYFSQSDAALSQAYLGYAWRWNGAPTRDATSTLPTSGNIVWWDGSAGAFTGTVSGYGYTQNVLTHTNSGKTLTATITTDADGSQRVSAIAFS